MREHSVTPEGGDEGPLPTTTALGLVTRADPPTCLAGLSENRATWPPPELRRARPPQRPHGVEPKALTPQRRCRREPPQHRTRLRHKPNPAHYGLLPPCRGAQPSLMWDWQGPVSFKPDPGSHRPAAFETPPPLETALHDLLPDLANPKQF